MFFVTFLVWKNYENSGRDTIKGRHKYVTFLIVLLILQSALRHYAVGVDTYSYYRDFEYTKDSRSWEWIFHNFYDVYVLGDGKDAGYHLLLKVFQIVCPFFRIFLFVIATGFFCSLFRLVEKEVTSLRQLFFSFCVYQTLFYSFFSITGIRQTIATIATFYAIKLIRDNKIVAFVILLLVVSLIHKSVLLFLPFFFISKIKMSKTILLGAILLLPVIMGVARPFAMLLALHSGSDAYMQYAESEMETGGAVNFLIFMLVAAMLTLLAKRKRPENMPDMWANAMAVSVIFVPLMWVDTSLMRVIQYYAIFSIITIPLSIDCIFDTRTNRNIAYWILFMVLLVTTIRHNYEYGFFWQEMKLLY